MTKETTIQRDFTRYAVTAKNFLDPYGKEKEHRIFCWDVAVYLLRIVDGHPSAILAEELGETKDYIKACVANVQAHRENYLFNDFMDLLGDLITHDANLLLAKPEEVDDMLDDLEHYEVGC